MRQHTVIPTPFHMMALGLAVSAAMASMFLRAMCATVERPADQDDDAETAALTPEDEVRLLHTLE